MQQVRLGNYLDSWNVPDGDGSLEPSVRKMVRDGAGVPSAPIGQRPAWAFERVEELSSPEADNVCQRIPGVQAATVSALLLPTASLPVLSSLSLWWSSRLNLFSCHGVVPQQRVLLLLLMLPPCHVSANTRQSNTPVAYGTLM